MADVLIVCVREDEPQAKALAEMFEAAGFSIGGAPSSDAALRSSGAGVVVWSQASIRSRPFLDAAQRVINANKAVVASLIEPPPPSSIGESPAFDLSHWDGDPNDPSLDPLFFAVDRMVNAARASVGASAREDDYHAPPPAPRPAPRAAPAPAPAPPRQSAPVSAPMGDHLGSEAEHWRAIRDSRDPADFMDYLSRYGPEGAFAEVAELRLKQLTAAGAPPAPTRPAAPPPTRMPQSRYAEPQSRYAEPPPPPRREPPQRREPAHAPPPPPRRAEAPRRMPPPERGFDRAELREPAPSGPLRAIILIAVLGGAALGGGLYFGGGMGGSAPREQTAEVSTDPLDAPSGVPIGEPDEIEPLPVQVLDRGAAPPAARQERQETPQRAEPPPPQPRTTTVASNTQPRSDGSGGPLSLTAPASSSQTARTTPPPPSTGTATPPTQTSAPAITSTPPPPQPPQTAAVRASVGSVQWSQRPTARRIGELYPQRALREGLGGRVQMDCTVERSLSVNCTVASESPADQGFGRAALNASSAYRARPTLSDGTSAVGTRTRIAVNFVAPQ